jgi:phosphohistidine phosphatase
MGRERAMKRLILMRHGDAERQTAGLADFDRGLTAEGRAESKAIGKALAKAGFVPDLALVSAARRTTETWKASAAAFARKIRVEEDRGLYAASAVALARTVREAAPDAGTVILVGHNPGIHQYAIHLAMSGGASAKKADGLYEKFPTGSAAVFSLDLNGRPALERLFLAKDYRDKGE